MFGPHAGQSWECRDTRLAWHFLSLEALFPVWSHLYTPSQGQSCQAPANISCYGNKTDKSLCMPVSVTEKPSLLPLVPSSPGAPTATIPPAAAAGEGVCNKRPSLRDIPQTICPFVHPPVHRKARMGVQGCADLCYCGLKKSSKLRDKARVCTGSQPASGWRVQEEHKHELEQGGWMSVRVLLTWIQD